MSAPGPSGQGPSGQGPSGCTLAKLRSFVMNSNLAPHLRRFSTSSGVVEQVERHFRILLRGIKFWELDRIQPMFTALCMLILTKETNTDGLCFKRSGLMGRFIGFVDCLDPMKAHQLLEKMLEDLAEYQVDNDVNLLKLASKLYDISPSGRVLAVCLLWTVLGHCLPALEITMYRYREPMELVEAIRKKPPTSPSVWLSDENELPMETVQANMESLRVMLEAMERVLDLLLSCDNDDLRKFGYPDHFFVLERAESTFLSDWCIDLSNELPASMCGSRGKFGAPLHGIIGLLMKCREESIPDFDASAMVETTMNLSSD
ncbi:uncharacterized protein LOC110179566 [Drosophila serrata]|uniref:uncharacterized protein LOC110179566 n=1 Tax=Drosophila serrata TaxID=7274 RepID=UPI000A1D00B9|nr:uncharacterized protein LOC110179566 [Drosophila serrata]